MTFTGNLLAPRLSHRLRWRTRLGSRGTAVYVVGWAAFGATFIWAAIKLARLQEETRAEVRAQLGREPLPGEMFEYLQSKEKDPS